MDIESKFENVPASGRTRNMPMSFRATEGERAAIVELVSASKMTFTNYVIWSLLDADKTIYAIDQNELNSIRLELARQGNNINQIAYSLNVLMGKSNNATEEMLEDTLGMILQLQNEQLETYRSVMALQSKIHRASLKRLV